LEDAGFLISKTAVN